MDANQEIIPIFFTIDEGYAPYLDVAISSIVANASNDRRYCIYIMHEGLQPQTMEALAAHGNDAFQIEFVRMADQIEGITDRMCNRLRADYFTLTIYFRLFIPEMFPQLRKGIYLDSDIVVPGDIAKLYDTELGDNLIGAVHDFSINDIPDLTGYVDKVVGIEYKDYVNSGVLVMNLERLREVGLERRFIEVLNRYHFDVVAPDQDYLNVLCHGKIVYLPECWDAMPIDARDPLPSPNLIHYNLFSKPWLYDGIKYGEYFWKYARESAFFGAIVAAKESYSDEQKASDTASAQRMCMRAAAICETPDTFAAVFNTGKESRL